MVCWRWERQVNQDKAQLLRHSDAFFTLLHHLAHKAIRMPDHAWNSTPTLFLSSLCIFAHCCFASILVASSLTTCTSSTARGTTGFCCDNTFNGPPENCEVVCKDVAAPPSCARNQIFKGCADVGFLSGVCDPIFNCDWRTYSTGSTVATVQQGPTQQFQHVPKKKK